MGTTEEVWQGEDANYDHVFTIYLDSGSILRVFKAIFMLDS